VTQCEKWRDQVLDHLALRVVPVLLSAVCERQRPGGFGIVVKRTNQRVRLWTQKLSRWLSVSLSSPSAGPLLVPSLSVSRAPRHWLASGTSSA